MYKTPKFEVTKEMLSLISKIDEIKGYWNCLAKFTDIKNEVSIQNTAKDSAEAVSLVLKYDEKTDMTGYLMALNWVFTDFDTIILSETIVDKLFNMIENLPPNTDIEKNYAPANTVDDDDNFGSIFGSMSLYEDDSTDKNSTQKNSVQCLMEWAGKELLCKKTHPLLIACIVSAEILNMKIYPRANSRLSRILTLLIMLKAGYSYIPYHSLDKTIKEEYSLYETAYENAQEDSRVDFEFWNTVYLKILHRHALNIFDEIQEISPVCAVFIEDIAPNPKGCEKTKTTGKTPVKKSAQAKKSTDTLPKASELPPLQMKILKLFEKSERVTISDAVNSTKANVNTIKKHLAALNEKNFIEKHGKTRGAWYTRV